MIEIERKFLVTSEAWRPGALGESYCQGYLSSYPHPTVRVRTRGAEGFLTIKGEAEGISRLEFEYAIPVNEAQELQRLCTTPLVVKMRYRVAYEGAIWEIDEFQGENEGLIVAEIELDREDRAIKLPPWIGQEVSDDPRYSNSNLSIYPFKKWQIS